MAGIPADKLKSRVTLANIGRKSFVTLRGLDAVLHELHEFGFIDDNAIKGTARRSIKRARHLEFADPTCYGLIVRTIPFPGKLKPGSPSTFNLSYVHPLAAFRHACDVSEMFRQHVQRQFAQKPSAPDQPWNIVLYTDEITCGDPRSRNTLKMMAVYWTFKELGSRSLCNEYHWFLLTATDADNIKCIDGGMSAFAKHLLLLFFQEPNSLSVNGMVVADLVIFAIVGVHCSDLPALKAVLEMKGHGGLVPCLCCRFTTADTRMAVGVIQDITNTDLSLHVQHDDASVHAQVDNLRDCKARLGPEDFKRQEMAVGLNYVENGVLCCNELRNVFPPVSSLMYDWMHIYIVNGLWNCELGLLLGVLFRIVGIKFTVLHEFIQTFTWPLKFNAKDIKSVFARKTFVTKGDVTASASEALSVYNVVRLFLIMQVMRPRMNETLRAACISYFALCSVLDLLSSFDSIDPNTLHDRIKRHIDMFKLVYGEEEFHPKHHFALHLPSMLAHHKALSQLFQVQKLSTYGAHN